MNQRFDFKIISEFFLVWLILSAVLLPFAPAFAETASAAANDLQAKIDERNKAIAALELEIANYELQIDVSGKQASDLQTVIKGLDVQRKKLAAQAAVTQNQIEATALQIEQLAGDIGAKAGRIEKNKSAMGNGVRELSHLDSVDMVTAVLNYQSLSEFWNEINSIAKVDESIRGDLLQTQTDKQDLESQKTQSEQKKKQLISLKSELADQQKIIEQSKAKENALLSATKNKQANYKKILAEKQAARDAFEKELLDFESQLQFNVDLSKLPSAGHIFNWPLDFVKITQEFGKTLFAAAHNLLYGTAGHNGIDLKASVGTPVKAALAGVVAGTGDTDTVCPGASYGRWVLIGHGNGLSTLYAHFSLIKVSAGQSVDAGELIGYSGDTGYATGPHLHFTVAATQGIKIMSRTSRACSGKTYTMPVADLHAYLNPMDYL